MHIRSCFSLGLGIAVEDDFLKKPLYPIGYDVKIITDIFDIVFRNSLSTFIKNNSFNHLNNLIT